MKPFLGTLIVSILMLAGCQTGGRNGSVVVERFDLDLSGASTMTVQLRLINGLVEVVQSPNSLLTIEVLERSGDSPLPSSMPGLAVAQGEDGRVDVNVGAKYMGNRVRVYVPKRALLLVYGADSDVRATGVDCDLWLSLQSGDVTLKAMKGQLKLRTLDGVVAVSIEELRLEPAIEIETIDGHIDLQLPREVSATVSVKLLGGELKMVHPGAVKSNSASRASEHIPQGLLTLHEIWRIGDGEGPGVVVSSTKGNVRIGVVN